MADNASIASCTASETTSLADRHRRDSGTGALRFIPRRYLVAFLAFLGFCNVYMLRVDLSVAIVAMTNDGDGGVRRVDYGRGGNKMPVSCTKRERKC